eukprot:991062_1
MMHRLRQGFRSLFGYTSTFWHFFREGAMLARSSAMLDDITIVTSKLGLSTSQGRGRSILRMALRKNCLSQYLRVIKSNARGQNFISSFYSSTSVVGGCFNEILAILHQLECENVRLDLRPDDPKLDVDGFWKMTRGFPTQFLQHSVFAPSPAAIFCQSRSIRLQLKKTNDHARMERDLVSLDIGSALQKELSTLTQKLAKSTPPDRILTEKDECAVELCLCIRDCLSFGFKQSTCENVDLPTSPRTHQHASDCRPSTSFTLWDLVADAAAILDECEDPEDVVTASPSSPHRRSISVPEVFTPFTIGRRQSVEVKKRLSREMAISKLKLANIQQISADFSPQSPTVQAALDFESFVRSHRDIAAHPRLTTNSARASAWVMGALNQRELPTMVRVLFCTEVLRKLISRRFSSRALVRRPEDLNRLMVTFQALSPMNFNFKIDETNPSVSKHRSQADKPVSKHRSKADKLVSKHRRRPGNKHRKRPLPKRKRPHHSDAHTAARKLFEHVEKQNQINESPSSLADLKSDSPPDEVNLKSEEKP